MKIQKLEGLIAAAHSPFGSDGAINLSAIEKQAQHYLQTGIKAAFICGSTGESHSLTLAERRQMAERWRDVVKGTNLKLIVHVGSNCLSDAAELAEHAGQIGAYAISALSPSYFKPGNVETLVESMAKIATRAPSTPFYFYDIPALTNVNLSMVRFLELAPKSIPNLVGLKFTNSDMSSLQHCLQYAQNYWDILWGVDEVLLAALTLGVRGAVGSSFNFCAPLHLKTIAAFEKSDWATARKSQHQAVQWIEILARYGYMAAAKFCLECQGVPVGPARLPQGNLSAEAKANLLRELQAAGFMP